MILKELNKRMQGGELSYLVGEFTEFQVRGLARGLVHLFVVGEEVQGADYEQVSLLRGERGYVGRVLRPADQLLVDFSRGSY